MSFDINGALSAGYSPSEIMENLSQNPDQSPMPADGLAEARKHYSDDEIVKDMASRQPKTLLGAAIGAGPANAIADGIRAVTPGSIQRGSAHLVEGLANTADVLGADSAGSYLHRQVNQEQLHAPSSIDAIQNAWHQGNYGQILSNLPGAIGESVPALTGALLGAGAGAAVGGAGVAGAALGAGSDALIGVATQAGNIAKARAQADGRSVPNDADIAVAIGSSGVIGALDRIGLGKAAGGALASTVKDLLGRGAAGRTATAVGSMAVHGSSDAAASAIQQTAETAGTQQGLTINPDALATQAIVGAGTRGALGAAHQVVDTMTGQARSDAQAVQAAKDRAEYSIMTPEEQNTVGNNAAAFSTLQETKAASTQNPADTSTSVAARTASSGYARDLGTAIDTMVGRGDISSDNGNALRGLVSDAANSQRKLIPADVDKAVDGLELPDATRQGLKDSLNQVDMLSSAGIKSRDQSSLGRIGGVLGGAIGIGLVSSHPFLGAQAGSAGGSKLGNWVADKLGLTSPPLVREGSKAVAMLEANGVDVPQTRKGVMDAVSESQDAQKTMASMLGLNPENYGFSASEQRAMAKDSAKAEADRQKQTDASYAANDAAKTSADNLAADKSSAFDQADRDHQTQVDAGFADMEAQQRIQGQSDKLDTMRANQTTKDQIRGFLADQAATKAAQDARATQESQITADGDRQATRGQAAMSQVQATTENAGVRLGNIGDRQAAQAEIARQAAQAPQPAAPQPVAPQATQQPATAPQAVPAPTPQPAAPQAPSAAVAPPVAPPAPPRTAPAPVQTDIMPGTAEQHGKRLPDWQYKLGENVEDALNRGGNPRQLNYAQEANAALGRLESQGLIDNDFRTKLVSYDGRMPPRYYNLVRNEMLLHYGIDRRTLDAQQPQRPPMAIAAE